MLRLLGDAWAMDVYCEPQKQKREYVPAPSRCCSRTRNALRGLPERRHGLVVVVLRWSRVGAHDGFRVSPQAKEREDRAGHARCGRGFSG